LITQQNTASSTLTLLLTVPYKYLDQVIAPSLQGGLAPEEIGILGEMCGSHGGESLCRSLVSFLLWCAILLSSLVILCSTFQKGGGRFSHGRSADIYLYRCTIENGRIVFCLDKALLSSNLNSNLFITPVASPTRLTTLRPAQPRQLSGNMTADYLASLTTPQGSRVLLLTLAGLIDWFVLNVLR